MSRIGGHCTHDPSIGASSVPQRLLSVDLYWVTAQLNLAGWSLNVVNVMWSLVLMSFND